MFLHAGIGRLGAVKRDFIYNVKLPFLSLFGTGQNSLKIYKDNLCYILHHSDKMISHCSPVKYSVC